MSCPAGMTPVDVIYPVTGFVQGNISEAGPISMGDHYELASVTFKVPTYNPTVEIIGPFVVDDGVNITYGSGGGGETVNHNTADCGQIIGEDNGHPLSGGGMQPNSLVTINFDFYDTCGDKYGHEPVDIHVTGCDDGSPGDGGGDGGGSTGSAGASASQSKSSSKGSSGGSSGGSGGSGGSSGASQSSGGSASSSKGSSGSSGRSASGGSAGSAGGSGGSNGSSGASVSRSSTVSSTQNNNSSSRPASSVPGGGSGASQSAGGPGGSAGGSQASGGTGQTSGASAALSSTPQPTQSSRAISSLVFIPALSAAPAVSGASMSPSLIVDPFASSRPFTLEERRIFALSRFPDGIDPALCSNGVLDFNEECDDANRLSFDGCSELCLFERGSCGDGTVQRLLNEQCEPGIESPVQCNADCRFVLLSCGNGIVDSGEDCDAGTGNSDLPDAPCRIDCSLPRCGDRIIAGSEFCDDGNRLSGDGCSAFCVSERNAPQTLPAQLFDLPFMSDANDGDSFIPALPCDCPAGFACDGLRCVRTATHAPAGDTGPAAVLVIATGAAMGIAWARRKKRL